MSTPDHSRFDELVSRYLDASLSPAEERELLQYLSDGNRAARFQEATQLETEIAGVLAGSIPDEVMIGLVWNDLALRSKREPSIEVASQGMTRNEPSELKAPTTGKNNQLLLALAAVVVALLVAGAVFSLRDEHPTAVTTPVNVAVPSEATSVAPAGENPAVAVTPQMPAISPALPKVGPSSGAQVASVRGEVYLVSSTGRTPISNACPLKDAETIKTVGSDSRATLALADGTRVELLGNTTFLADLTPGLRHLYLAAGSLRATVSKQPENQPMVFEMPQARATVRGTELALVSNSGSDAYLVVYKGAVSLQRTPDEQELLVKAGSYAHVEVDMDELHAFPNDHLPQDLREQLSAK